MDAFGDIFYVDLFVSYTCIARSEPGRLKNTPYAQQNTPFAHKSRDCMMISEENHRFWDC